MDGDSLDTHEGETTMENPELQGRTAQADVTEEQKAQRRSEIEKRAAKTNTYAGEPPGPQTASITDQETRRVLEGARAKAKEGTLDSSDVAGIARLLRQLPVPKIEPLIQNPSPEQIKEVHRALEDGQFEISGKVYKVVRGSIYSGVESLVLLDPDTKQEFTYTPGVEKPVALYTVADPEPADVATPDQARAWLEAKLRPVEGREYLVGSTFEDSLLATIQQKIPETIGVVNIQEELLIRARARIRYHNSDIKIQFYLGDFTDEFWKIQHEEHKEIFNTPGVKEALVQMTANEGRYFRLRDYTYTDPATGIIHNDYTDAKNAVIAHLQTPAGGSLNPLSAKLAVELAKKTANIFGESAYFDGIRVKNTVAAYTDPTGAPVPWATPDRFVSYAYLQSLYPAPTLTDEDRFARFFEEHQDDIDFATSLSGQGALYLRRLFYLPISYEKTVTVNKGKAKYLRRFAYMWLNSAARFTAANAITAGVPTPYTTRVGIVDQIDNLIAGPGDMGKVLAWAFRVSTADKGRGQFADKGSESVLNVPLISPNQVTKDNTSQTLPAVMENYKKIVAAYEHLSEAEREKAMAHFLRGELIYVNSQMARDDDFNYSSWSHKICLDTIWWAVRESLIDRRIVDQLKRELRVSENIAAFQAGQSQFGEAVGGLLRGIFEGIFRR